MVLLITAYVVISGIIWFKLFGFSRKLQRWIQGNWGRYIMFVCGIKLSDFEKPTSSNFILMPNHRSYIDIFIVATLIPSAMVGKAELAKWPFAKLAAKATQSILVDRKDSKSLLNTMKKIKESVEKEIPVTLFPEGTTFEGPLTKRFKNGSFKIAADANIPVIPMAIEYRDKKDAWVGNDTFVGHFFRQLSKPVTHVTVQFGTPIQDTSYQILQQNVKNAIDQMLTKIENQ